MHVALLVACVLFVAAGFAWMYPPLGLVVIGAGFGGALWLDDGKK